MSAERASSIRLIVAMAMAMSQAGCIERAVKATDLTPAAQPGIVIDSTRFRVRTWDPVLGPAVEGYVVVHNSAPEQQDRYLTCEGRPHQQQLIVWSEKNFADLAPGQSEELWFWGHSTREGLLDITCRVQPAGDRS